MPLGPWKSVQTFYEPSTPPIALNGNGDRRSIASPGPMSFEALSSKAQWTCSWRSGLVRRRNSRHSRASIGCTAPAARDGHLMVPPSARRQSLLVLASFAITACGSTAAVKQSTGLLYDSVFTESLGSGVVHRRLVANSGPFTIHVVEANMRRRELTIGSAQAFDSL